jgi:peroxiredoxin
MNKIYFNLVVLTVAIFSVLGCKSDTSKGNLATVSINFKNTDEGQVVYLEDINGPTPVAIDTAVVDNAKLKLTGAVTTGIYRLLIPIQGGMRAAILFLEPSDKLSIDFDLEVPNDYAISGNKESKIIMESLKSRDAIIEEINGINGQMQTVTGPAQQDSLNNLMTQLIAQISANVKSTIESNTDINPSVTALLLSLLSPQTEYQYIVDQLKKCLEADPNSGFIQRFAAQYQIGTNNQQPQQQQPEQAEQGLAIGSIAPAISQPSPTGQNIPLSSLKGKYVLIDFWASWCKPCRMENPNVVRTYNQFKDKGFEVYSVSLDKSKDAWIKAINDDGLAWSGHVSDLMAWQSVPARDYGVRGIPATYLIDPQGVIIAKNLRGPALEEKLTEVFNTPQ